jgi:NAD-dependent DNA ligase
MFRLSSFFEIEKIVGFELGVRYISKDEICPDCGSKLSKNGSKSRLYNKIKEIEQQQYSCTNKKCNFFKIVDLSKFISKGCSYSNIRLE